LIEALPLPMGSCESDAVHIGSQVDVGGSARLGC
jgi:hypothetical protein